MWLACGGVARGAVDARDDALAGLQLAVDRLDDDRLVVARAHDVGDARRGSRRPRTRSTPASEICPPPSA